jgi:hypothetical protein
MQKARRIERSTVGSWFLETMSSRAPREIEHLRLGFHSARVGRRLGAVNAHRHRGQNAETTFSSHPALHATSFHAQLLDRIGIIQIGREFRQERPVGGSADTAVKSAYHVACPCGKERP